MSRRNADATQRSSKGSIENEKSKVNSSIRGRGIKTGRIERKGREGVRRWDEERQ